MAKKKKNAAEDRIQDVESALSKTEQFIEENQKILTTVVLAIVVVVIGFLAFKRFIVAPSEEEAHSQMFVAEQYFERDSFDLALYGDGNYLGFLDIIEEYKITKSANLAHYYAGISYLKSGEYKLSIDYLKKFNSDDIMLAPIALGAIGDAFLELEEPEEAISYYNKAANLVDNEFVSPIYHMKAGMVYEELGNYKNALDIYKIIQEKYPDSSEGRSIEKFITRVKLKLE